MKIEYRRFRDKCDIVEEPDSSGKNPVLGMIAKVA